MEPARVLENAQPLVRRLPTSWTPEYCFKRLANLPGCVWLDSSLHSDTLGRYSYMSADPFSTLRVDKFDLNLAERLDSLLRRFYQPCLPDLPPMQGGWMCWFGYVLGTCFERVPYPRYNEFHFPLAALGL